MVVSYLKKHLKTLFIVVFFINGPSIFSQELQAILLEPEFEVVASTNTRWSYSFGLANRGILVQTIDGEEDNDYTQEHIEFNHYTIYGAWEKSSISLGFRYRFREIFDKQKENEVRFIEQFDSEDSSEFLGWSHRARFEQRIRSSETIFRLRYEFGLSKKLNRHFSLELATEALYSVSPQLKPEPEQRLEIGLENTTFRNWELYLGAEFRRDNYVRSPENELFFLTAATINL